MTELDHLLDAAEDVVYDGPPGQEAAKLVAAAELLTPGEEPRAELLRCAVEWLVREERYDEAERCAEAAMADGGPTWTDARADLVDVLLETGSPRAEGVLRELRRDLDLLPNLGVTLEHVADALHDAGWYREAIRWYSIVLEDTEPEDLVQGHAALGPASRRRQSRRALGRPRDRFDQAAEREGLGIQGDWAPGPISALLVWPDHEFSALLDRWPDLWVELGTDPLSHHAAALDELESMTRLELGNRSQLAVVWGAVDELVAHAASRGIDPRHGAARRSYARSLVDRGLALPWTAGQPLSGSAQ